MQTAVAIIGLIDVNSVFTIIRPPSWYILPRSDARKLVMRKRQRDAGVIRRRHPLPILVAAKSYRCTNEVTPSYRIVQLSLSIGVTTGTKSD